MSLELSVPVSLSLCCQLAVLEIWLRSLPVLCFLCSARAASESTRSSYYSLHMLAVSCSPSRARTITPPSYPRRKQLQHLPKKKTEELWIDHDKFGLSLCSSHDHQHHQRASPSLTLSRSRLSLFVGFRPRYLGIDWSSRLVLNRVQYFISATKAVSSRLVPRKDQNDPLRQSSPPEGCLRDVGSCRDEDVTLACRTPVQALADVIKVRTTPADFIVANHELTTALATPQRVHQRYHSLTSIHANNLLGTHDLNTRLRVGNSSINTIFGSNNHADESKQKDELNREKLVNHDTVEDDEYHVSGEQSKVEEADTKDPPSASIDSSNSESIDIRTSETIDTNICHRSIPSTIPDATTVYVRTGRPKAIRDNNNYEALERKER
ncbi:hypothetical protein IGI04_042163 [Brassica rapa subsp. trilocularis]|uniref:Uncharacterized protein n=1 Tax=Brassica rapa subsp. trilocularis TaxID=1813537 RepID=A0ABQ7KMZ8_BRACM|nr:hypothetical protein IGI04_042163 [Brassica rapa subsp. trilocularis]